MAARRSNRPARAQLADGHYVCALHRRADDTGPHGRAIAWLDNCDEPCQRCEAAAELTQLRKENAQLQRAVKVRKRTQRTVTRAWRGLATAARTQLTLAARVERAWIGLAQASAACATVQPDARKVVWPDGKRPASQPSVITGMRDKHGAAKWAVKVLGRDADPREVRADRRNNLPESCAYDVDGYLPSTHAHAPGERCECWAEREALRLYQAGEVLTDVSTLNARQRKSLRRAQAHSNSQAASAALQN